MITKEDILADLHTHTIFSLHAYSTIEENIAAAERAKLKFVAITDHFYSDGTDLNKRNEASRIAYMYRINAGYHNVYVVNSAEFNIAQKIDYWNKISDIAWRPIGLHAWFVDRNTLTLETLYALFKESTQRHNAFVHIERELHKIQHKKYKNGLHEDIKQFLQKMVQLAKDKNIYLELNESSIRTNEDNTTVDRINYWLKLAKENGNRIYLGTDAHYSYEIGNFENAIALLNKLDYPKDLILNCNLDQLNDLLKK